jgi:hypothetical protein
VRRLNQHGTGVVLRAAVGKKVEHTPLRTRPWLL